MAHEENQFLSDLSRSPGIKNDRPRAARILRAVIYAFRDRITVFESLDIRAQLMMPLKRFYLKLEMP